MMDRMRAKGYEWHRSTIAKIESAERPIRINEAADLVSLFGISLADLLSGHKNASTSAVQQRREIEQTVRRRIATEILAKMP